ncbi:MAG TPA: hypothetical protein ENN91_00360 [Firmicutes bacterium]|nr:hypothetical protein [Bacillota bacterium]
MMLLLRKGLFLLVCLLLLAAAGCSESGVADDTGEETTGDIAGESDDALAEDEQAGEDSENGGGEEALSLDDWEAPANLREMIATFEEIQHNIIQDGEVVATIHYLYEGSDTVDGSAADRVSIDFGDEKFIIWVDSAGELKKIHAGGEELPAEMASMFIEPLLANILMPFQIAQDWNVKEIVADYSNRPGVDVSRVKSEQQEIGGRSALVHTFEITVEPPAVEAGQGGAMLWQIADFGDLQVIIGWEVLRSSGEELNIEFKVDKIVLR